MSKKTLIIISLASIAITIVGLVTGKFFFLFLLLPLGFGIFNNKNKDE